MDGVSSGPSREVKEAYVYIVTVAGRLLELPAPYFSNIDWPAAEALAKVVAEAMRVPLTTELPPGSNPHPGPGALRNRIAGSILVGFGAVAVLVGSMLVFVHLAAAVWPGGRPPAKVEWWFGLPFVVVGGGFGWIGCGFLEWGWRRWVLLLAGESVGGWLLVLAIHWLG
jgi:hypothetical protein